MTTNRNLLYIRWLLFASFYFMTSWVAITAGEHLHINEFMSSNGLTIADEDGDFEDWIEIYNFGDKPIDLTGYHLSDKIDDRLRWQFPQIILEPDSFLLVFASGKNKLGAELHTNFSIKRDGEPLILSNESGEIIDNIPPVILGRDQSYGRFPDGSDNFYVFDLPTPGHPNKLPFGSTVIFSNSSGFYTSEFNLEIHSTDPDVDIYYTTNGDIPQNTDHPYTGPIELKASENLENNPIINIPTNAESSAEWYRWKPPGEDFFKAHIIRARTFLDGEPYSQVETSTYFISEETENPFQLPIISIGIPNNSLFNYETGIYVPGKSYEEEPLQGGFWTGGNFHNRGIEWEREAEMFFFEPDFSSGFEQRVGIRIHGSASRSLPQKSLRLYARESYGQSRFEYEIFPGDELKQFKRLLLRNSGQDFLNSLLADGLSTKLVEDLSMETQNYRPAVLFINGAYWGLINIRERFDKYYFEGRKGVDEDELDYLEHIWGDQIGVKEGEGGEYWAIMDFVQTMDISDDENFQILDQLIDIENFIDYHIAKMFYGVFDWPSNNMDFWRDRSVDGKWRYLFFDNDDAFEDVYFQSYDHLTDSTDNSWPNPLWSTAIFRNLMQNDGFKNDFFDAVRRHLNTTFRPENTVPVALHLINQIEGEIPSHIERWGYPQSETEWANKISDILEFLEKRPCVFWDMTLEFFNKNAEEFLIEFCEPSETTELTNEFLLYPNPATNKLNLVFKKNRRVTDLNIYDMSGRLVAQPHFGDFNYQQRLQMHLHNLTPGIYLLEIKTQSGLSFQERIVIAR